MKLQVLLAGATVLALSAAVASTASAAPGGKYAEPSQPVAYSKLNSYLKATPRQRARKSWALDQSAASTGTATNTSATTPQAAMATPQTSTTGDVGAAGAPTDQAGPAGATPGATPGTSTMPAPQPDAATTSPPVQTPSPTPNPVPGAPADNMPQSPATPSH
jgi:hypothetical protein